MRMPLMIVSTIIGFVVFRASSGQGASQALQTLSNEEGFLHLGFCKFCQNLLGFSTVI